LDYIPKKTPLFWITLQKSGVFLLIQSE